MTSEYITITLQDVIGILKVERVKTILSVFSSPPNEDIERYIKDRAIDFSNRGIAQTHMVFKNINDSLGFLGYFTLANKILTMSSIGMSNETKKRVERFSVLDSNTGNYNVAAPLIAQLGKNYSIKQDYQIPGKDLLHIACEKVRAIQKVLGRKLVYLECGDKESLISFYQKNGFRIMESGTPSDKNLIQMVRFL